MKLKDLNPCKYESRIGSTIRAEWNKSKSDAMWLVSKAHFEGTLERRSLVGLILKTIQPCFELMPLSSKNCVDQLQLWVDGDNEIDLTQLRDAASAAADAAYAADAAAARAAAAAFRAADAAYATYAVATAAAAYAADAAAASAAAFRAAYADAARDSVDVRLHITVEECCNYLGLDPDEVLK